MQAVRETVFPQADSAPICLIDANGDAVNVAEANSSEPLWLWLPTFAGVREHSMHEEKCRELGRPSMLRYMGIGKSNNEKGE